MSRVECLHVGFQELKNGIYLLVLEDLVGLVIHKEVYKHSHLLHLLSLVLLCAFLVFVLDVVLDDFFNNVFQCDNANHLRNWVLSLAGL